jgi:hypothetical protein
MDVGAQSTGYYIGSRDNQDYFATGGTDKSFIVGFDSQDTLRTGYTQFIPRFVNDEMLALLDLGSMQNVILHRDGRKTLIPFPGGYKLKERYSHVDQSFRYILYPLEEGGVLVRGICSDYHSILPVTPNIILAVQQGYMYYAVDNPESRFDEEDIYRIQLIGEDITPELLAEKVHFDSNSISNDGQYLLVERFTPGEGSKKHVLNLESGIEKTIPFDEGTTHHRMFYSMQHDNIVLYTSETFQIIDTKNLFQD